MPLQTAKATFEALQMGMIYASEIGDEASLKEIRLELESLLNQHLELASQAQSVLKDYPAFSELS